MQFPIVDVALGVVFLFVTLSMIVSAGVEAIAWFTNRRSKHLLQSLNRLLDGTDDERKAGTLTGELLSMPSIGALPSATTDDRRCPPNIEPAAFAHAVLGMLARRHGAPFESVAQLEAAIGTHVPENLRAPLLASLRRTEDVIDTASTGVADWFDTAMKQASAWYRQSIHKITLAVALVVTVAANADVLEISQRLWTSPALRASVAQAAEKLVEETTPATATSDTLNMRVQQIETALAKADPLPLGWKTLPQRLPDWLRKVFGLLLTWAGLSLGAPFWFDVLRRLIGLRQPNTSGGAARGKAPDAASKP